MKKEMMCCWEILVLIKIINNWRKISMEKEVINKKVCILFFIIKVELSIETVFLKSSFKNELWNLAKRNYSEIPTF